MKLIFEGTVANEDTGLILGRVFAYSIEGFEEELYKLEMAAKKAEKEEEALKESEEEDDFVVGVGDEKQSNERS